MRHLRLLLASAVVLLWQTAGRAAPVPPYRYGADAEVVLRAWTGRTAPELRACSRSPEVMREVLRSPSCRRIGWLAGRRAPEAWLAARLDIRVTSDGRAVVLRLSDCPRREAVSILAEVVRACDARIGPQAMAAEVRRRRELMGRMRPRFCGSAAEWRFAHEQLDRYERMADVPFVLRAPRLMTRPR